MTAVLKDDTELFKQFSDNERFKKWLTDTVFAPMYMTVPAQRSGSPLATKGSYKLVCLFNEAQAHALGTFIRRIGWSDIKRVSTDEHELIQMLSAIDVVRACLAKGGYPLGYPIEHRARKR